MELKQHAALRLEQRLVMTPQLQQAIKLLQLSRLELIDEVRKELDNNPVLSEEDPEAAGRARQETSARTPESEERDFDRNRTPTDRDTERAAREVDWEKFLENRTPQQAPSAGRGGFEELPPIDQNLTRPRSLQEHLLWQLQLSDFTEVERRFAELVIGNLDERGYLDLSGAERPDGSRTPDLSIDDLARDAGLHLDDAPLVLELLQNFDPIGIAARDLRECLLIQAKAAGFDEVEIEI